MGIIIKARDLPAFERSGIQRLIIYCKPDEAIVDSAVSLNVELAKKLDEKRAADKEKVLEKDANLQKELLG